LHPRAFLSFPPGLFVIIKLKFGLLTSIKYYLNETVVGDVMQVVVRGRRPRLSSGVCNASWWPKSPFYRVVGIFTNFFS